MLTPVLIFLNVAIFILTGLPEEAFPMSAQLKTMGMSRSIEVWDGEVWRLVTAMFLHGGIPHLLFNMYGLYLLGPVLEHRIGTGRFLLVYFAAGIYGFVVSLIFLSPLLPTLGASGALFGIMGALIGDEMRVGKHPLAFLDTSYGHQLFWLAGVNLVIGFVFPIINNAAHIGGLVAGVLFTQVALRQLRRPDRNGWLLRIAAVVLCLEGGLYSFIPVFNGDWHYVRGRDAWAAGRRVEAETALKRAEMLQAELLQWTRAQQALPSEDTEEFD